MIELAPAVATFGQEVQDILDDVLRYGADATENERQIKVLPFGTHYVVRSGPKEKLDGIPLFANGKRVAKLEVEFRCELDTSSDFLAVRKSKVQLASCRKEDPLFRLDYQHDAQTVPTAHWNIHAERGAVSALLATANPGHTGRLSKVHFPVGGTRHRPCLEDALDLLIREFNVDVHPDATTAIQAGRERWRIIQTKVLVRDAPELAAGVLRKLGYKVDPPEGGPPPTDTEQLRKF